jgi:hypothetical protein
LGTGAIAASPGCGLLRKALQPFLTEIAGEREHELDLIERSVRTCFEELIARRNDVLTKHLVAQDKGDPTATGLAELEAQKVRMLTDASLGDNQAISAKSISYQTLAKIFETPSLNHLPEWAVAPPPPST